MTQYETAETDNEFQQAKIKDLIDEYNVTMFTTNACHEKPLLLNKKQENSKREYQK